MESLRKPWLIVNQQNNGLVCHDNLFGGNTRVKSDSAPRPFAAIVPWCISMILFAR